MLENLPNFFIVGAAKSGTTSLYWYLSNHPDIYMSPIKEPNFFAKDLKINDFVGNYREPLLFDLKKYFSNDKLPFVHIAYIRDLEVYLKLFKNVRNKSVLGEASTSYLFSKVAAREIHRFNPSSKILIILRNPVDRAFSHYLMNLQLGLTDNTDFLSEFFEDLQKTEKGWGISHLYLELGLYYEQVKRYLDFFTNKNVKIVLYEDFKSQPEKVLKEIFCFLGVKRDIFIDFSKKFNVSTFPKFPRLNAFLKKNVVSFKSYNPHGVKKFIKKNYKRMFFKSQKPSLSFEARIRVFDYFKNDIQNLGKLTGLDLKKWEVKHYET